MKIRFVLASRYGEAWEDYIPKRNHPRRRGRLVPIGRGEDGHPVTLGILHPLEGLTVKQALQRFGQVKILSICPDCEAGKHHIITGACPRITGVALKVKR